jgi:hypothetical protein
MITAHSSDVGMPPGHYDKIAQVLRGKINNGGLWWRDRPKKMHRSGRVRVYKRDQKGRWVKRTLEEAAINDPDDRHEFWISSQL